MAEAGKVVKARKPKAFGTWAVAKIFQTRSYGAREGPKKQGKLHSSNLQWTLAGLSDTWHELQQQVCSVLPRASSIASDYSCLCLFCVLTQAAAGSPDIDNATVVTAYLQKNGVDLADKISQAAHSNLCGKLADAAWLAALKEHLPQFTGVQQATGKAGM